MVYGSQSHLYHRFKWSNEMTDFTAPLHCGSRIWSLKQITSSFTSHQSSAEQQFLFFKGTIAI